MRLLLARRSAATVALLGLLLQASASAGTTVARVMLDVPARPGHAAANIDLSGYTLDAVADFSLVRLASNATRRAATRLTVEIPAAAESQFATQGTASRFAYVAIRQANAAGDIVRRTIFYDVRVARIEKKSGGGDGRRITLVADRVHDERPQPAQ
jgi:hypothetical protein